MVLNLAYDKNKLYETLDFWSRDMVNFDLLERGVEIVPQPHFGYDFSREICYIILTDQMSLSDCLYFLRY